MTTWYRISRYKPIIEEVEVVKETAQCVNVAEKDWRGVTSTSRHFKAGEYFPTREEAKSYLIAEYERELGYARDRFSVATNNLKQAREL